MALLVVSIGGGCDDNDNIRSADFMMGMENTENVKKETEKQ
jgi:hypothetical protein